MLLLLLFLFRRCLATKYMYMNMLCCVTRHPGAGHIIKQICSGKPTACIELIFECEKHRLINEITTNS